MPLSRRSILLAGAGLGAAGAVAGSAYRPRSAAGSTLTDNPFKLGHGSGDPTATSIVLWTRLAVEQLASDGLGGFTSNDSFTVEWKIGTSRTETAVTGILQQGTETANATDGFSIHAEVNGLPSGAELFYQFKCGSYLTRVGRTLTAPAPGVMPAKLDMSFASCAHYQAGYFTAYRHMAEAEPDLILHLGDYIYEAAPISGLPRLHAGGETSTLAGYRQRYAQYHTDPDLRLAHSAAPWLVVWDDHEVDNNWAGNEPENQNAAEWNDTTTRFRQRRAAAFRAFWENMPLRRTGRSFSADMRIYQRTQWGALANFHMLDTRQYRDDQACDLTRANPATCGEMAAGNRSITGATQEQWLLDGFQQSTARWDLLGQQVFFSQRRFSDGNFSTDSWDGYQASRDRITQGWVTAGVRNPVVLTGDVHEHWAADILSDYSDPTSIIGSEIVSSSISSGQDGSGSTLGTAGPINGESHLRYNNKRRGYVRTRITPTQMTIGYKTVARVSVQDDPVVNANRFAINDGQRGLVAL